MRLTITFLISCSFFLVLQTTPPYLFLQEIVPTLIPSIPNLTISATKTAVVDENPLLHLKKGQSHYYNFFLNNRIRPN